MKLISTQSEALTVDETMIAQIERLESWGFTWFPYSPIPDNCFGHASGEPIGSQKPDKGIRLFFEFTDADGERKVWRKEYVCIDKSPEDIAKGRFWLVMQLLGWWQRYMLNQEGQMVDRLLELRRRVCLLHGIPEKQ